MSSDVVAADVVEAEVIEPLTEAEAKRMTMSISLKLDAASDAWKSWTGALPLIREAIVRDAYKVLGFRSHSDYIVNKFSGKVAGLPPQARRELVQELAAHLSQRALAEALGVSQKTISLDMNHQVIPPVSPGGEPSGGTGVSTAPVPRETAPGIDGKPQKRLEPKDRAPSLPKQFARHVRELYKAVTVLQADVTNPRFSSNRQALCDEHEKQLENIDGYLLDLIEALTGKTS